MPVFDNVEERKSFSEVSAYFSHNSLAKNVSHAETQTNHCGKKNGLNMIG